MRLIEREVVYEEHFTEGEPDLEPPEELALVELDDDHVLEEDLESELISEEDVDDATLEMTLEDLVEHDGQELSEDPEEGVSDAEGAEEDRADLEVAELEDVEESLDRILAWRLASDEPEFDSYDGDRDDETPTQEGDVGYAARELEAREWNGSVPSCRVDEFVCSSCHLVRNRAQLAANECEVCRDCSP